MTPPTVIDVAVTSPVWVYESSTIRVPRSAIPLITKFPMTDKFVTPVMSPSISVLPVIVRPLLPPARVEPVLMVEPVKVRSPPDRVTAPV